MGLAVKRRAGLVVAALLLLALGITGALVVFGALTGAVARSGTEAPCRPAPCVAPQGMELHVDAITRSGADVVIHIHVVNHTTGGSFEATSARHTGLADFSVRAGSSSLSPDISDSPPECAKWDDLVVARGASSPSRTVCFRVPPGQRMTLTWSPDLGLLFRSVDLDLGSAP